MFPLNEATPTGFEEEVPFTFLLGIKELFMLIVILSFGFGGFTLCFNKIYAPSDYDQDINNVAVYSPSADEPYMTIANMNPATK